MRATRMALRTLLLLAGAGALVSCASKPALPKRASIETAAARASQHDFAALVPNADIIYFPTERAASGARSEPAALLLEALQRNGSRFAIAWDVIEAVQQPVLDSLVAQPPGARERSIRTLELAGTGRAREHCRAVLRDPQAAAIRHLALGFPHVLEAKLRANEPLTPEEQQQLGAGFQPPVGGLEAFAERLSTTERAGEGDVAAAYRAHLLRQQFAAARIVQHFQTGGSGDKLLVFLPEADLAAGLGVPYFVAQKLQLRQLVLGSDAGASGRAKLLTRGAGGSTGRVEIVDGAPGPAGD